MNKLNPKFTADIQEWLETPAEQRDIIAGARLLLQANRNRALYNSITMRPQKFAAKLEYELRKHLQIRLRGMSLADVVRLENAVMPRIEATVAAMPVISTDNEIPEGKGAGASGRRADHDSLPPEIQQLWDDNATRAKQIRALFAEIKAMADAEPCDRFERLSILDKVETAYREAYARYDAYGTEDADGEASPVDKKRISALRKSISQHRKALASLPADDRETRPELLGKLQGCVTELLEMGAGLADNTRIDLEALGIVL